MLIKILEERRRGPILKVDGYSGKLYRFRWDETLRAYVHEPASQKQIDDFFAHEHSFFRFAPVSDPQGCAPPEPVASAEVRDALAGLVENAGVAVHQADTTETLKRLLRAYDRGTTVAKEQAEAQAQEKLKPKAGRAKTSAAASGK